MISGASFLAVQTISDLWHHLLSDDTYFCKQISFPLNVCNMNTTASWMINTLTPVIEIIATTHTRHNNDISAYYVLDIKVGCERLQVILKQPQLSIPYNERTLWKKPVWKISLGLSTYMIVKKNVYMFEGDTTLFNFEDREPQILSVTGNHKLFSSHGCLLCSGYDTFELGSDAIRWIICYG